MKTCQSQRMAYITNRRLFENAFEIAARASFSGTKISLKLVQKNKRLPPWWNWRRKNKMAENSKANFLKKVYKTWKIVNIVRNSSTTNSMDEYTDEEIIIIDDFKSWNSMQFNELLILLNPYHSAPAPARYRNKFIQYRCSHNFAPNQWKLISMTQEDVTQLEKTKFKIFK